MSNRTGLLRTNNTSALMMHYNGKSHVLLILVSAEKTGRRLWLSGRGRLLQETGRMDIPCLLVEYLRGGGAFVGDPRISRRALRIVFGIFQSAKIMVNLLRRPALAVAALYSQQDGDVLRLSTPIAFGPDGAERAGESFGDPPGSRVRDGQLPISRWPRRKQPHLFSQLDGILLIPIPTAGALESAGELNLHSTVCTELVVFESSHISIGC